MRKLTMRLAFMLAVVALVSDCKKDEVTPTGVNFVYRLDVTDPASQNQLNGIIEEELNPFEVEVANITMNQTTQQGVLIQFKVVEGSGAFKGNQAITVPVDGEGKARATLTLGSPLLELNRIKVTLAPEYSGIANTIEFTGSGDKFRDHRDDQVYRAVKLQDDRIWMAENLNYDIPGYNSWWYDKDLAIGEIYGRLYDWYAAQQACTELGNGWTLPTDEDWKNLAVTYGGYRNHLTQVYIGDPQKSYNALIEGGSCGFNALLGGATNNPDGSFYSLGDHGYYWSLTEYNSARSWFYHFDRDNGRLGRNHTDKRLYFSCRCIKEVGN